MVKKLFLTAGLIGLLTTAIVPIPAQAQNPVPAPGQPNNGVIRLFDSVLVYPLPDWTNLLPANKKLQGSLYSRQQSPTRFGLEMVPRSEKFTAWKNLYALMAFKDFKGDFNAHRDLILENFKQGCVLDKLAFRPVEKNDRFAIMIVECGAYKKNPAVGEIGAFVLFKHGTTAVRLYREWRGPAFNPQDPASWPVLPNSLEQTVLAMSRARLGPPR